MPPLPNGRLKRWLPAASQAGGGDEASEARFTKHVAQWHQHIYDRVQSIRERVRPD